LTDLSDDGKVGVEILAGAGIEERDSPFELPGQNWGRTAQIKGVMHGRPFQGSYQYFSQWRKNADFWDDDILSVGEIDKSHSHFTEQVQSTVCYGLSSNIYKQLWIWDDQD
jgi:hypothetical protein